MKNIIETLQESGSYDILIKAIKGASLNVILSSRGPYTVFAPTDDAFHKLPEGIMEELFEDKDRLKDILNYHISAGKLTCEELKLISEIDTLQGETITIMMEGGNLMVDHAQIIKKDMQCSNGNIQSVNMVLMP